MSSRTVKISATTPDIELGCTVYDLMVCNAVEVKDARELGVCEVLGVFAENNTVMVESTDTDAVITVPIDKIKPIILTANGVRSMGFVKVGEEPFDNDTNKGFVIYQRDNITIYLEYSETNRYWFTWEDIYDEDGQQVELTFVHELQNLYLSLKKDLLEYNETLK